MILFRAGELAVTPIDAGDLPAILEVYRQCEDFLALGPVPVASAQMVKADIEHSQEENGQYCAIRHGRGQIIGVVDFVASPGANQTSVLSLLMIAAPWRRKGYGRVVVRALEEHLKGNFGTQRMEGGVQTNNWGAIRFWQGLGYQLSPEPCSQLDGTVTYSMSRVL